MRMAVVGAGYVGLVTGACFANSGNEVVFVDVDRDRVDLLRSGGCPIYEPGLAEMLARNAHAGRAVFTTDAAGAHRAAEIIFICVGTPQDTDGAADLSAVFACADSIAAALASQSATLPPKIVVVKSTVPVGTTHDVAERIRAGVEARGGGRRFVIANNPEFLREGVAIDDFLRPDRVIVGVEDESVGGVMRAIYEPFTRHGGAGVLVFDVRSSEMVKYASNAMLATKISFINEMAALCAAYGADVDEVRRGMCADERIGPHFFFPGLGFGGSCFPKDVQACLAMGRRAGVATDVLAGVDSVNRRARAEFVERIEARFAGDGGLDGRRLAVWGVAFKPNTDDIREAPALDVIRGLASRGAKIRAYDPEAMDNALRLLGGVFEPASDPYEAATGADALVICTEWDEFRSPDFDRLRALLARPIVFDGRNIYRPDRLRSAGFEHHSIGRASEPCDFGGGDAEAFDGVGAAAISPAAASVGAIGVRSPD